MIQITTEANYVSNILIIPSQVIIFRLYNYNIYIGVSMLLFLTYSEHQRCYKHAKTNIIPSITTTRTQVHTAF